MTESKSKGSLFAIVVTTHRIWGTIVMPYILEALGTRKYYRMAECLSPFGSEESLETLDDREKEIVKLITDYSDRHLFRLFSREKNLKEFNEKVTPERFENFIKPYIEGKIYKILDLARQEDIPVFYQKTRITNLHNEDRLIFRQGYASPQFKFERGEEFSTYNLSIILKGKQVKISNNGTEILSNKPCLIKQGSSLIFVKDIEGSKLKPFLLKDEITIPVKSEELYFKTFVKTAINEYNVDGSGFTIIDENPVAEAILEIEEGVKGNAVAILKFRYGKRKFFSGDKETSFTQFENKKGDFLFRKVKRDFSWEESKRKAIVELGLFSEDDINYTIPSHTGDQKTELLNLIETINRIAPELSNEGFLVTRGSLSNQYCLDHVTLEMSHTIENDWFDLKAVIRIGDLLIPFPKLKKNILTGKREYLLPDGQIFIIPEAWFTRFRNVLELSETDEKSVKLHKQHFQLFESALEEEGRERYSELSKLVLPESLPDIGIPVGITAELRPYQRDGLNWLYYLQENKLGGCLADDMGLGKTLQTIGLLQHNKNQTPERTADEEKVNSGALFDPELSKATSIIIVPASLLHNWEKEINRFAPNLKVYLYVGNSRRKTTSYFNYYDIILSTYHTIRQDIAIISGFSFLYAVLDESQHIKNPASAIYKAVLRIKSQNKLVLTGTPVENSLTDLWTQLNFVNPGLLGSLSWFKREFAKPIEKNNSEESEKRLKKIIKPFLLRRTKEQVASDLPPVSEQTVFCDMTEEQEKLYDSEKSAVRNSILENIETEGIEKSAIVVLQGLMRLRQISNHPALLGDDFEGNSGKFETVIDDLFSVVSEGHKVLIFSSFVKHLRLFSDELTMKGIRFEMLTGSTTNREKVIDSFQNNKAVKVFLISLKAGGVGLNLTAADYVFILDPWWNPAAELQALSRAHRIGQDKPVFVYRYISRETIEEKIVQLQLRKSRLAETFVRSTNLLKEVELKEILAMIE